MRVSFLFDCHTFDAEPQGTSTFLSGLINALPDVIRDRFADLELDIHCASSNSSNVSAYIKVPYTFHAINTGFISRNLLGLPLLARRISADVVVSQYVRPIWVPKHSASIIHDVLFVDYPDQFGIYYRFSRFILFGLAAHYSSKTFTVSNYSRERISELYKIDPGTIEILPNAISASASAVKHAEEAARKRNGIHLLSVSRLERRKRHEWCVRAFEDLRAEGRDVRLTLIGGGKSDYANALRQKLKVLSEKHDGRFVHLEGVSQSRLESAYANADVFLFPSLGEGFGIPVIEAAAQGLPCVVSGGSALAELIEYYIGNSFDQDDYSQFLQAICNIHDRLDQYKSASFLNKDKVKAAFSWDVTAERFISSILELRYQ